MKVDKSWIIISLVLTVLMSNAAQAVTLKIATMAPAGSSWMNMMQEGATQVKKETDDRVKLKFYPGGVMGAQDTVLQKMRIGQLHGGTLTSGTLRTFYPDSQIYSLPLVFRNMEEIDYVRKKMDARIIAGLEQAGMVTFGLSEGGLAYAMSSEPIIKTADLRQRKVWSPENNKNVSLTLQAFDVSPVPLSISDVLIGLQTGLIDTVATSTTAAIALQWHTQIKYITDVPLIYFYSVLVIDEKAFGRLPVDDQKIVRRVMTGIMKKIDRANRDDNSAAFIALQDQGIKLVKPDSGQLADWYQKGDEATDLIFIEGGMSDKTKDEFMTYIESYRNQQASIKPAL